MSTHPTQPYDLLAAVRAFHEAIGHPVKEEPDLSDIPLSDLRDALIYEKTLELSVGLENQDVSEVIAALAELEVVIAGAWLSLGLIKYREAALTEVMRANMSKLGEDGKPIYRFDGKIMRGPNYSPPDMIKVITGVDNVNTK